MNLEGGAVGGVIGGAVGGAIGGAVGGAHGGARKKMYKQKDCAPGKNDVHGSCLDSDLLMKVGGILNKMSKKNKKIMKINRHQSIEDIHGDICLNISNISKCSSEACWQTLKSLMNELGNDREKFKESFKPKMPKEWIKDYNEWLSTFEIEDCLNQHMNSCDEFYFYGAVPIDFHKCSVSDLCSFNMKKHLKKGETKIGIVFNTDPSNKDGKHWISMYIDLIGHNLDSNPGIYYFDSFGRKPPEEILKLIKKIKKQGEKCNKKFMYFYNDYSYQKRNSQCGMYAIHFIKEMINDKSFIDYLNSSLSDKLMIKLRDEYFVRL
tara:strand:+ start:402 stop:1364 length:963 start_codon:yes stop_codon:yes gene_type:complete